MSFTKLTELNMMSLFKGTNNRNCSKGKNCIYKGKISFA